MNKNDRICFFSVQIDAGLNSLGKILLKSFHQAVFGSETFIDESFRSGSVV